MAYSTWHFEIKGRDDDTGEEITLVDYDATFAPGWPERLDAARGVGLLNDLIARLNERFIEDDHLLGDDEKLTIPFFGSCQVCRQVVDDTHLYGPDSDICDRCWAEGARPAGPRKP